MPVSFEEIDDESPYRADDVITAYGDRGTVTQVLSATHVVVKFENRDYTETVPVGKCSRA